jgi:hypothetical protein
MFKSLRLRNPWLLRRLLKLLKSHDRIADALERLAYVAERQSGLVGHPRPEEPSSDIFDSEPDTDAGVLTTDPDEIYRLQLEDAKREYESTRPSEGRAF